MALLLVRNFPEDLGLHPDGAARPPSGLIAAADDATGRPRRVLTSRAFWLLAVPLSASAFVSTALVFHQVSIFAERGLGADVAAATFAPYSLAATGTTTLLAGLLVGRVGTRWLMLIPQGLLLASLAALLLTATTAGAVVYGLLLGAGSGLQMVLGGVVWAEYYGAGASAGCKAPPRWCRSSPRRLRRCRWRPCSRRSRAMGRGWRSSPACPPPARSWSSASTPQGATGRGVTRA